VITGVHAVIYSKHPDKVRAFLRDVVGLRYINSGGDWPIFALPPAELGVHPTDGTENTELFLLCDDIEVAVADMHAQGIQTTGPVQELDWGRLVMLEVDESLRIGMYQPKHPSPLEPM
jgi:hypothetical protein